MTQKDKDLLLKDIYARIPYGVKGCFEGETFCTTPSHWYVENTLEFSVNYMVIKNGWRPYLFPLSSMTEEQKEELDNIFNQEDDTCEKIKTDNFEFSFYNKSIFDFLNKYHLDWRGLIPMGLANDATGLNIY